MVTQLTAWTLHGPAPTDGAEDGPRLSSPPQTAADDPRRPAAGPSTLPRTPGVDGPHTSTDSPGGDT